MINQEEIKLAFKHDNIILTNHVRERMKERNIRYNDIIVSALNGNIIEQYQDDIPHPSCLICGYTEKRQPLHIVISLDKGTVWIITAYVPALDKWDDNFKTRKAVK